MSTTSTFVQSKEAEGNGQDLFHRHIFVEGQGDSTDTTRSNSPIDAKLQTSKQNVLLLHAAREKYKLIEDHAIPTLIHNGEILVKVLAIGLNPIDWKAPAFNFGIPALPWINGRDFAGVVVQVSNESSRVRAGDIVLVPSTDYRDIRKAAFQEYAVATHYNAARIPSTTSINEAASLGVAFVASTLALGVSFGLDFSTISGGAKGPNLPQVLKNTDINEIPEDIREECFSSAPESERIQRGDWLAIWGASTTTGYITLQIAKLCGLKVICVADVARHGAKLLDAGADLLVDRHNTERAVEIIRGVTGGRLRFGLDIVGKDTAALLQNALFRSEDDGPQAHLLGLTGIPKEQDPRIHYHTVPIKLFHTSPAVGESMVTWLEGLLQTESIKLPEVVHAKGGLAGVNDALDILREGSVSGKRIVVGLDSQA
ncbi:hypothetical protein Plec18167_001174 [Paecilomyces lecythidis]|uniref:Enoyl reductase (ER) domain-containing protein n=1 Tax=Paecilomyces lecythidis TaxID=3004212 RepID=A0ABR3YDY4_9EURO